MSESPPPAQRRSNVHQFECHFVYIDDGMNDAIYLSRRLIRPGCRTNSEYRTTRRRYYPRHQILHIRLQKLNTYNFSLLPLAKCEKGNYYLSLHGCRTNSECRTIRRRYYLHRQILHIRLQKLNKSNFSLLPLTKCEKSNYYLNLHGCRMYSEYLI